MPGKMRQVPQTSWCINAAASNDQLCKGAHASLSAGLTWKGCEGPYKAFEGLRWFQLAPISGFKRQSLCWQPKTLMGCLTLSVARSLRLYWDRRPKLLEGNRSNRICMAMLVFWHCLRKLLNMPGKMRQVPQTSWCINAAASNDQLCKGAHASLSAGLTWKGCEGPYKAFKGLK